jgi:plastocyanin
MSMLGRSTGSPRALAAIAIVGLCLLAFAGSAAAAGPTAISIVDTSFQPADATIQAGETVTWTVTKAIADPHSVTSGTPSDSGKIFDSKTTLRANGDTFSYTFSYAGTFPYYCSIHPSQMHGTITVLGAAASGAPAGSPGASPAPGSSTAPGSSAAPASSGGPAASGSPGPETLPEVDQPPVSGTDKLIAAGILGATLVVLFGAASLWRRVNR